MDQMIAVAGDGLVVLFNGVAAIFAAVSGPAAWLVAICVASLTWLAVVEVDELDRQGRKPTVGRH